MRIYTIGHSTHPLDHFIGTLKSFQINKLIDVRTIPKSRFNPQFNAEALSQDLSSHGIMYRNMRGLGGLRHPQKGSVNQGWKNASFRGYADYMQTQEFEVNLQELIAQAGESIVAIMCAEAVPWRCHRSLIADALLVRGVMVVDIMGPGRAVDHKINPMARVSGDKLCYPRAY
ncbi:MAG: DUF488 domain-containing protein [Candidatus Omnitrophica bacterium]|nr:DUF488 domain-containing protein [Candidatus Omnitrophota bacterium]